TERIGAQQVLAALGQPYGDNYFTLTAQTNQVNAAPGQSTNVPVVRTTVAVSSWPGSNVTFSVSGLPWNCGAGFNTASLTNAATNILSIVASNNAPVGSYWLLPQGSGLFPNIRGGTSPLRSFRRCCSTSPARTISCSRPHR